jgi:hypothetical protein
VSGDLRPIGREQSFHSGICLAYVFGRRLV